MQTAYTDTPSPGQAGQLYDATDYEAVTANNAEASDEIPHGVFVAQGTDPHDAIKLTGTSDVLKGVVLLQHAVGVGLPGGELGTTGLKPKASMTLVGRGRMWVPVEMAVTPGDDVFVRAIATGEEVAGACRNAADSSDCIDISKHARWLDADGLDPDGVRIAPLEFDILNHG